jgi:hypothetical protein
MELPTTIEELVGRWVVLMNSLNDKNDQKVAYDMVGSFGGGSNLWFEWYENDNNKEPLVVKVFDNVADLELPDGINIKNKAERKKRWELVKGWVSELEKKYPQ